MDADPDRWIRGVVAELNQDKNCSRPCIQHVKTVLGRGAEAKPPKPKIKKPPGIASAQWKKISSLQGRALKASAQGDEEEALALRQKMRVKGMEVLAYMEDNGLSEDDLQPQAIAAFQIYKGKGGQVYDDVMGRVVTLERDLQQRDDEILRLTTGDTSLQDKKTVQDILVQEREAISLQLQLQRQSLLIERQRLEDLNEKFLLRETKLDQEQQELTSKKEKDFALQHRAEQDLARKQGELAQDRQLLLARKEKDHVRQQLMSQQETILEEQRLDLHRQQAAITTDRQQLDQASALLPQKPVDIVVPDLDKDYATLTLELHEAIAEKEACILERDRLNAQRILFEQNFNHLQAAEQTVDQQRDDLQRERERLNIRSTSLSVQEVEQTEEYERLRELAIRLGDRETQLTAQQVRLEQIRAAIKSKEPQLSPLVDADIADQASQQLEDLQASHPVTQERTALLVQRKQLQDDAASLTKRGTQLEEELQALEVKQLLFDQHQNALRSEQSKVQEQATELCAERLRLAQLASEIKDQESAAQGEKDKESVTLTYLARQREELLKEAAILKTRREDLENEHEALLLQRDQLAAQRVDYETQLDKKLEETLIAERQQLTAEFAQERELARQRELEVERYLTQLQLEREEVAKERESVAPSLDAETIQTAIENDRRQFREELENNYQRLQKQLSERQEDLQAQLDVANEAVADWEEVGPRHILQLEELETKLKEECERSKHEFIRQQQLTQTALVDRRLEDERLSHEMLLSSQTASHREKLAQQHTILRQEFTELLAKEQQDCENQKATLCQLHDRDVDQKMAAMQEELAKVLASEKERLLRDITVAQEQQLELERSEMQSVLTADIALDRAAVTDKQNVLRMDRETLIRDQAALEAANVALVIQRKDISLLDEQNALQLSRLRETQERLESRETASNQQHQALLEKLQITLEEERSSQQEVTRIKFHSQAEEITAQLLVLHERETTLDARQKEVSEAQDELRRHRELTEQRLDERAAALDKLQEELVHRETSIFSRQDALQEVQVQEENTTEELRVRLSACQRSLEDTQQERDESRTHLDQLQIENRTLDEEVDAALREAYTLSGALDLCTEQVDRQNTCQAQVAEIRQILVATADKVETLQTAQSLSTRRENELTKDLTAAISRSQRAEEEVNDWRSLEISNLQNANRSLQALNSSTVVIRTADAFDAINEAAADASRICSEVAQEDRHKIDALQESLYEYQQTKNDELQATTEQLSEAQENSDALRKKTVRLKETIDELRTGKLARKEQLDKLGQENTRLLEVTAEAVEQYTAECDALRTEKKNVQRDLDVTRSDLKTCRDSNDRLQEDCLQVREATASLENKIERASGQETVTAKKNAELLQRTEELAAQVKRSTEEAAEHSGRIADTIAKAQDQEQRWTRWLEELEKLLTARNLSADSLGPGTDLEASLGAGLDALRNRLNQQQIQITSLTKQNKELTAGLPPDLGLSWTDMEMQDKLKQSLEQERACCERETENNKRLGATNVGLSTENNKLSSANRRLEAASRLCADDRKALELANDRAEESLAVTDSQLGSLREQSQKMTAELTGLQKENETLTKLVAECAAVRDTLRTQSEGLATKLTALETDHRRVLEKSGQLESQAAAASRKTVSDTASLKKNAQQLELLSASDAKQKNVISQLQNKINGVSDDLVSAQQRVSSLEQQLRDTTVELKKRHEAGVDLSRQLEEQEEILEKAKQEECAAILMKLEVLQGEASEKDRRIQQAQDSLTKCQEELQKITAAHNLIESQIKEHAIQHDSTKADLSTALLAIDSSKEAQEALVKHNDVLTEQLEVAKRQNEETLEILNAESDGMKQEIQELTAAITACNLNSTEAEERLRKQEEQYRTAELTSTALKATILREQEQQDQLTHQLSEAIAKVQVTALANARFEKENKASVTALEDCRARLEQLNAENLGWETAKNEDATLLQQKDATIQDQTDAISQLLQQAQYTDEILHQLERDVQTTAAAHGTSLAALQEEATEGGLTLTDVRRRYQEAVSEFEATQQSLQAEVQNSLATGQHLQRQLTEANEEREKFIVRIEQLLAKEDQLNVTLTRFGDVEQSLAHERANTTALGVTLLDKDTEVETLKQAVIQQEERQHSLETSLDLERTTVVELNDTVDELRASAEEQNAAALQWSETVKALQISVDQEKAAASGLAETINEQQTALNRCLQNENLQAQELSRLQEQVSLDLATDQELRAALKQVALEAESLKQIRGGQERVVLDVTQENKRLLGSIEEQIGLYRQLQKQLDTLTDTHTQQASDSTQVIQELNGTILALKEQISSNSARCSDDLTTCANQIEELQRTVADREGQLATCESRLTEKRTDNENILKRLQNKTTASVTYKERCDLLNGKLINCEQESIRLLKEMREEFNRKSEDWVTEQTEKQKQWQDQREAAHAQGIANVKGTAKTNQEALQKHIRTLTDNSQKESVSRSQEILALQNTCAEAVDNIRRTLQQVTQDLVTSDAESKRQQQQHLKCRAQVEQLKNGLRSVKSQYEGLFKQTNKELSNCLEEKETTEKKLKQCLTQSTMLKQQFDEFRIRHSNSVQAYDDCIASNRVLHQRNARFEQLRGEHKELIAQRDQLQNETTNLRTQTTQLNLKLKEKIATIDTLKSGVTTTPLLLERTQTTIDSQQPSVPRGSGNTDGSAITEGVRSPIASAESPQTPLLPPFSPPIPRPTFTGMIPQPSRRAVATDTAEVIGRLKRPISAAWLRGMESNIRHAASPYGIQHDTIEEAKRARLREEALPTSPEESRRMVEYESLIITATELADKLDSYRHKKIIRDNNAMLWTEVDSATLYAVIGNGLKQSLAKIQQRQADEGIAIWRDGNERPYHQWNDELKQKFSDAREVIQHSIPLV